MSTLPTWIDRTARSACYIGLMSGTSLDGVDAVLIDFSSGRPELIDHAYSPYPESLRETLLSLHAPGMDETNRGALTAIELSRLYSEAVLLLLEKAGISHHQIAALGCHGQTIRHRPESGYSIQLADSPLLAELTGITVVSNFRNRDIAAGGQGAPLVPAFHEAVFRSSHTHRVILNLGGIANLTDLPQEGPVRGFDCGPGNMLMDAWTGLHLGKPYDDEGEWACSGKVLPSLLDSLLKDDYFSQLPPKSTGRDRFNLEWLESRLTGSEHPEDVQATLLFLTAKSAADSIEKHCSGAREIYLCGGGARNSALWKALENLLPGRTLASTDNLGIASNQVEAAAFAWLARQTLKGLPGNLPEVTGARGRRILGAIHPA